jgi:hypothetical protein
MTERSPLDHFPDEGPMTERSEGVEGAVPRVTFPTKEGT